jgi:hypothetical protein
LAMAVSKFFRMCTGVYPLRCEQAQEFHIAGNHDCCSY